MLIKKIGTRLYEWIDSTESIFKQNARFIILLVVFCFFFVGILIGGGIGVIWIGKNHPLILLIFPAPPVIGFLIYVLKADKHE